MKTLVRIVVLALVGASLTLAGPAGAASASCTASSDPFTDVSSSSFAREDITCIYNLGVTTGTSATTYSPKDNVTREQMAAFLARLYTVLNGSAAPTVATPFTDVSSTSFAKDAIARIYGLGITTGTSSSTYSPKDNVTREQMAAFLSREYTTLETLIILNPGPPTPPPGTNDAPEFGVIANQESDEGEVVSLAVTATDSDGDTLTYTATGLPAGLTINTATGLISGTISFNAAASSPYTVTVTVADGRGGTDAASFSWSVLVTGGPVSFASAVSYPMPGDSFVGKNPVHGLLDPVHGIEFADLDDDGVLDMAAAVSEPANSMVVRLGDGDGTFGAPDAYFTASSPTLKSHPKSVRAFYVNGDDVLDLVTANQETETAEDITVFLGNGDGTFQSGIFSESSCPGSHDANGAYLNNDAFLDLVVACTDTNTDAVTVMFGNGNGTFQNAIGYQPFAGAAGWPGSHAVDVGDVDGDGDIDLVVANLGRDSVGYLRNTGSGSFAAAVEFAVGEEPHDVVLTKVNNDAHLDLVTANQAAGSVSVRYGNGNGTFAPVVTLTLPAGSAPKATAVADLNNDGRPDIVVANSHNNYPEGTTPTTVSVILQKIGGGFEPVTTLSANLTPFAVSVADLNGDDRPDIGAAMWNSEDVKILLQN